MSLMTLVRLFAALFLAWTLVALGIGAMGGGSPSHPTQVPLHFEPPLNGTLPDRVPGRDRHELVNLATGRSSPLHVPEEDRWTIVTVSPWRDASGDLEVVGRWVSRGEGAFCGMGSFRLSDRAVLSRVPMEILPTGQPCWVPGQERTILFPAGDGHLYRCHLPAGEVVAGISVGSEASSDQMSPVPVTWKVPVPGVGSVFLTDPVWSTDSRLRKWVIVSLGEQIRRGPRSVFEESKVWWLEMSDQADSILAAGRLTVPANDANVQELFPNVAVGPEGKAHLVYLTHRKGQKSSQLRSAELQFDVATGRPSIATDRAAARTLGEVLETAPLLVSADGTKVFSLESIGRVRTFNLEGDAD